MFFFFFFFRASIFFGVCGVLFLWVYFLFVVYVFGG